MTLNLNKIISDLEGYRQRIENIPRGKQTRLFAFTDCLWKIKNTAIGANLLEKIHASGKQVSISLNDKSKLIAKGDLTVDFDPRARKKYILVEKGLRKIGNSSPDASLFHELVHIYRYIYEAHSYSNQLNPLPYTSLETEYDNVQEWDAIHGLGTDSFNENAYRKEAGLPHRVTHLSISFKIVQAINTVIKNPNLIRTAETENTMRFVLREIFKNGLEAEARAVVKNETLNFSDLEFLFDGELLIEYFDKHRFSEGIIEFDGIRKNIACLLISAAIQQKSFDPVKAEEFFADLFKRSSFKSLDFQKELCRLLSLDLILRRTSIVQNALEEENVELLKFLISEKGMNQKDRIWHKDVNNSLTISQYAQECEFTDRTIELLFSNVQKNVGK